MKPQGDSELPGSCYGRFSYNAEECQKCAVRNLCKDSTMDNELDLIQRQSVKDKTHNG